MGKFFKYADFEDRAGISNLYWDVQKGKIKSREEYDTAVLAALDKYKASLNATPRLETKAEVKHRRNVDTTLGAVLGGIAGVPIGAIAGAIMKESVGGGLGAIGGGLLGSAALGLYTRSKSKKDPQLLDNTEEISEVNDFKTKYKNDDMFASSWRPATLNTSKENYKLEHAYKYSK